MPFVPCTRSSVQTRHTVGLLVEQACMQHVCKEVVVAIPTSTIVQRDYEQVRPLQRLQHGLPSPIVQPGYGIAQRATQTFEDGGVLEKTPDSVALPLQEFFHQVVDDVAVVASEARNELGDVGPPLYREGRKLQRGNPSFSASLQRSNILCRQLEADCLVEVRRRLIGGEAQIGGTDLDELALCP